MNKIRWKYYILFIILNAIDFIIIAFLFPETKGLFPAFRLSLLCSSNESLTGLSLEEMGKLFGDSVDAQEVLGQQHAEKEEGEDKHNFEHV